MEVKKAGKVPAVMDLCEGWMKGDGSRDSGKSQLCINPHS